MLPSSLLSLGSSKPDHHLYMFIQIWLLLETLVHVQGTLKGTLKACNPKKDAAVYPWVLKPSSTRISYQTLQRTIREFPAASQVWCAAWTTDPAFPDTAGSVDGTGGGRVRGLKGLFSKVCSQRSLVSMFSKWMNMLSDEHAFLDTTAIWDCKTATPDRPPGKPP